VRIQNIYNKDREIYLFCRDREGKQDIIKDNSFFPFYYEPNSEGKSLGYKGEKLKKVFTSNPKDIYKARSYESFSSDVQFTTNYIVHNIDRFEKTAIRYFFIDIETISKKLPVIHEAKDPVSCISLYDSLNTDKIKVWYINDYEGTTEERELQLLNDFIKYFQDNPPDLWLSWNVNFDYGYLYHRLYKKYKRYFAKEISPIKEGRYAKDDKKLFYPAGIGVVDYLIWFKRLYRTEKSYALDYIAQTHLNEEKWQDTEFGEVSEVVKAKNINDVNRMCKLENKYHLMDYYDEIRIFTKTDWEDLIHNSRIIDNLILSEAKNRNVVLPSRPFKEDNGDSESFQGAYRRAETGRFYNIYKADVSSMYPEQLINFCLDNANLKDTKETDCIEVDSLFFKQDKNAILPFIARKLIIEKTTLKQELKNVKGDKELEKKTQIKYNAYKALVNSLFGVTGFSSFRLYNPKIASTIAFLARDLLHYVEDKMKERGLEVVYLDTDSVMYKSDRDEIEYLNDLVQEWSKSKYNKDEVSIYFESEGKFDKLLITGKCHYYGITIENNIVKAEIKGIEIKRSSSSVFESWFQEELIKKILDKVSEKDIIEWIRNENNNLNKRDLLEISFPAKVNVNKEYVTEIEREGKTIKRKLPIHIRAFKNGKKLFKGKFKVEEGSLFHYVFVRNYIVGGQQVNAIGIDKNTVDLLDINMIDWNEMARRNILSKTENIFKALSWSTSALKDTRQLTLF